MKNFHSLLAITAVSLTLFTTTHGVAQELLSLPDFEATAGGGEIPGWMLEETITGSTDPVNAAQQQGFANEPMATADEFGLWLTAFNGGDADRGFAGINAILSQTVAATPGETYNFIGHSNFEQNYSGGVDFLDGTSPLGMENGGAPVASPTQSFFDLEFLDGSGTVIGSSSLDLVNDDFQFSGGGWLEHTPVTGVAPANTTQVRVSAKALDMVENINPGQSGFYDNFSLTTASAPAIDLLQNGNLNTAPPSVEDLLEEVYDFIETPDTENTLAIAGFANDPATGGSNGIWVRPFIDAGTGAEISQTVEGSAGTEYTFGASARWEVNYLGDGGGGENETLMQIAFLDDMGAIIDMVSLDLRADGKTADNAWSSHSVTGTAPEGTVEVAVSGIVNNLTNNTEMGGNQSGFWDDFTLMAVMTGIDGDFDGDGDVDIVDFGTFGQNFGLTGQPTDPPVDGDFDADGDVDIVDFGTFGQNFGIGTGGGSAVPEPTSMGLAMLLLASLCGYRRR